MSPSSAVTTPDQRLEVLFEELAELAGQRNAIDGRIVDIVAEMDRDELCGATGARSVAGLVAWKLGTSSTNAHTMCTVAGRLEEFGISVVFNEAYLATDKDYSALLTRINASNVDALALAGTYTDSALITKQARAIGFTKPIVGGTGLYSPQFVEIAGKATENVV